MSEPSSLADRVVDLELLLTHLQNDFETLNTVVIEQRQEIDQLARTVAQLESRLQQAVAGEELPDPLDEKPPHY